ncbi:MAG TPA: alpha/beta hydrolase [Burkholderiaceae bacterium]|nr:alpha/beta hydrolase [Burkholderiaceae bacterium]
MAFAVSERSVETPRHKTFYLSCGTPGAPPIVFVHGWPELSLSWRHQLPCFASLGFHAVAPDMRGYGGSSIYRHHEDYALEHAVADMLELLVALGHDKAVWVGHDWGAPVVWSIASHHPEACVAVANLCVPYFADGFNPEKMQQYLSRDIYPEAEYPVGQWDYMLHYEENFDATVREFEADVRATLRVNFRKGNPERLGKPSPLASIRKRGSWFGAAGRAPDLPLDTDVLSQEELEHYASALQRNGFFGPNAWYMNHRRNTEYAARSLHGGKLTMPVLFLHARYDATCETLLSRLAEPMRRDCAQLREAVVESGHWMAQEKPLAVNAELARWLACDVPTAWPG